MNSSIAISIDAASGDHGLAATIPSALAILSKYDDLSLILVGDEKQLQTELAAHDSSFDKTRLDWVHAPEIVGMDEAPAKALRSKRASSMRVAINLVKEGKTSACVSAGNTGALMAMSRYVLGTLAGIERPAITKLLPTLKGHTHILDLGANVDCKAEQLFQFAVMGSVLAAVVDNIKNPRVGLLNIGQETIKGNDQVKTANTQLENSSLNYVGYVEGNQIYQGVADVIVADGFVGNIALKSIEGTASFITELLRQAFDKNYLTRVLKPLVTPVLKSVKQTINPAEYNGASLLGLQGVVIKSHGYAPANVFEKAIEIARLESLKRVPQLLDAELEMMLKEEA